MLNRVQILARKKSLDKPWMGIYFLIKGEEIVYVGQTREGEARIRKHAKSGQMDFDSYAYRESPAGDLGRLEAEYTIALRPKYNKRLPTNNPIFKSISGLKFAYGLGPWTIKKIIKRHNIKPHKFYGVVYYRVPEFDSAFDIFMQEYEESQKDVIQRLYSA